jgi:hypothetical protein
MDFGMHTFWYSIWMLLLAIGDVISGLTMNIIYYWCSRRYPRFFVPGSPKLVITANLIGMTVSTGILLRTYMPDVISCIPVHWMMYLGFVSWQTLLAARTHRLYWALERHQQIIEEEPWRANNLTHIDHIIEQNSIAVRKERRIYMLMGLLMIITIGMAATIHILATTGDGLPYQYTVVNDDQAPPYADTPLYANTNGGCVTNGWGMYPLFCTWGIMVVYTLPMSIYKRYHIHDHLNVHKELILSAIFSAFTFILYVIWTVRGLNMAMTWPCSLFYWVELTSVFFPLIEIWRRHRLARRVVHTQFEEMITKRDAIWKAFCTYAARDLCAENTRFIEAYRDLVAHAEQAALKENQRASNANAMRNLLGLSRTNTTQANRMSQPANESDSASSSRDGSLTTKSSAKQYPPASSSRASFLLGGSSMGSSDASHHTRTSLIEMHSLEGTAVSDNAILSSPKKDTHQVSASDQIKRHTTEGIVSMRPLQTAIDVAETDENVVPLTHYPNMRVPAAIIPEYQQIFDTFIRVDAPWQLNLTHNTQRLAAERVNNYEFTIDMFAEVYAEVKWSLWVNTFPKFIQSYEHSLAKDEETSNGL